MIVSYKAAQNTKVPSSRQNRASSLEAQRNQPLMSFGQGSRNRNNNNEVDIFGGGMGGGFGHMDIFKQFGEMSNRMFRNFDDNFGMGGISSMMRNFGAGMMNFGGLMNMDEDFGGMGRSSNNMFSGDGGMHVVSKAIVQRMARDENGRMVQERFYKDSVQQKGRNGQIIAESRQAYQNSGTGVERIGHERRLDDRGKKIVRERIHGEGENAYNYYNNLDEHDDTVFNNEWRNAAHNVGLGQGGGRKLVDRNQKPYRPGQGRSNNDDDDELTPLQQAVKNRAPQRNQNDLQPTQPARRLIAIQGPAISNAQPARAEVGRQVGTNQRAPPPANSSNHGSNQSKAPSQGVFKNQHPSNTMPKQG